eukprot:s7461_g4.t1
MDVDWMSSQTCEPALARSLITWMAEFLEIPPEALLQSLDEASLSNLEDGDCSASVLRLCSYGFQAEAAEEAQGRQGSEQVAVELESVVFDEHTDASFMTLAPVGSLPGLQFRDLESPGLPWLDVESGLSQGHLVAFVGDFLEVLTRGAYVAARHRVCCEDSGKQRFSMPFLVQQVELHPPRPSEHRPRPVMGGAPPMGAPPMGGPPLGAPPMGGPPGPAPVNVPPPPTVDQMRTTPAASTFPGTGMGAAAHTEPPAAFGAAATAQARGLYPQADSSVPGAPGAPAHGGMQTSTGQDAYSAQFLRDVETFNSPAHFVRCSVSRLPNSASAKQRLNIPLGVVLQPLAPLAPDVEQVPSVNFGAVGTIVRCKQCRTYVNPFVQWEANGRRWNCNLCGFSQLTPDTYYASLDESGKRMDRFQRAELHKGAVEYIAPGEYMVRPPQPPVFMFVIDVSYTSVVTGLLNTVVASIKEAIQSGNIPGGQRVQVGIITFDTSLHFYNLNSNLSQPQMLVVSDLEDLFLPLPDDILVPLAESEAAILNLLDSLPSIFGETKVNESCLGSAVRGAFMAMKHIGGKLLVFGACIPSVGELALKSTRDNPRLLGTDREVELLRPAGNDGYKQLAQDRE